MHTIPMQSSNSSDDLRSFRDTPHIHLTIILSVLIIHCTSTTFKAQVSLPYTNTLCTQAEYSFPFNFKDIPLNVRKGDSSLNLPQAHFTLCLTASSTPPPQPITSPKNRNYQPTQHCQHHQPPLPSHAQHFY